MTRPKRRKRPLVRPWALAGPILILLIAAPLLGPLWAPGQSAPAEHVSFEAVRSALVRGSLELDPKRLSGIDPVLRVNGRTFSQDPPAYDVVLAGVGWAIDRSGVKVDQSPVLFMYLLTFFAITFPTAVAGGLVYRTGRLFELGRPWRFGLTLACVLSSGWFAYATTLRPHALAAAGVMAAIASVAQFISTNRAGMGIGWLAAGGFCAAGAGVIEPMALWVLPVVMLAALTAKTYWRWRIGGLLLAIAGAAGPIAVHVSINPAITGDFFPPRWHMVNPPAPLAASAPDEPPGEPESPPTGWTNLGRGISRLTNLTVGEHGLFSHFPVLLIGLAGAGLVLTRHWPWPIKSMAGGTLLALACVLVYKMIARPDAIDTGYAAPRLVIFAPAVLLWAGAWLRRPRGAVVWVLTILALLISTGATIVGAISTPPRNGYSHYTFAEAIERLALSHKAND